MYGWLYTLHCSLNIWMNCTCTVGVQCCICTVHYIECIPCTKLYTLYEHSICIALWTDTLECWNVWWSVLVHVDRSICAVITLFHFNLVSTAFSFQLHLLLHIYALKPNLGTVTFNLAIWDFWCIEIQKRSKNCKYALRILHKI